MDYFLHNFPKFLRISEILRWDSVLYTALCNSFNNRRIPKLLLSKFSPRKDLSKDVVRRTFPFEILKLASVYPLGSMEGRQFSHLHIVFLKTLNTYFFTFRFIVNFLSYLTGSSSLLPPMYTVVAKRVDIFWKFPVF